MMTVIGSFRLAILSSSEPERRKSKTKADHTADGKL